MCVYQCSTYTDFVGPALYKEFLANLQLVPTSGNIQKYIGIFVERKSFGSFLFLVFDSRASVIFPFPFASCLLLLVLSLGYGIEWDVVEGNRCDTVMNLLRGKRKKRNELISF